MKRFLLLFILFLSILSAISARSYEVVERLNLGINEGKTRKLKDTVDFRTSFFVDERLGVDYFISSDISAGPFVMLRYTTATFSAPPIRFYDHIDAGVGCHVSYRMKRRLSLSTDLYTGTGKYKTTHTYISFVGAGLSAEYSFSNGFFITPQLQFERSSYQDNISLSLGAGVRI